jgi:hypothetical protein
MARNNREHLVQNAGGAIEQMKYEIAQEFGIQLGAETTSRQNGSVGGEITKRLVAFAEQSLSGRVPR